MDLFMTLGWVALVYMLACIVYLIGIGVLLWRIAMKRHL